MASRLAAQLCKPVTSPCHSFPRVPYPLIHYIFSIWSLSRGPLMHTVIGSLSPSFVNVERKGTWLWLVCTQLISTDWFGEERGGKKDVRGGRREEGVCSESLQFWMSWPGGVVAAVGALIIQVLGFNSQRWHFLSCEHGHTVPSFWATQSKSFVCEMEMMILT